jgi:hypothetical protein
MATFYLTRCDDLWKILTIENDGTELVSFYKTEAEALADLELLEGLDK